MSKVGSGDSKNTLYCSFCGKSQHELRKLKHPSRSRVLRSFLDD